MPYELSVNVIECASALATADRGWHSVAARKLRLQITDRLRTAARPDSRGLFALCPSSRKVLFNDARRAGPRSNETVINRSE